MPILQIVQSIIPIILLIGLGYVLHEKKWIDDGLNSNLTFLVMNVALPASIFVSVTKNLTLSQLGDLSLPLLVGAAGYAVNYAVSFLLMKAARIPRGRRASFINAIVNANTIFIGMPLNDALFGSKALPYFLVCYVLNTISTWTIGAVLMANDPAEPVETAGKKENFSLKKLLPPPILGFLAAVIFLAADIRLPGFLTSTFSYLGGLVTPLSLLYIGIILSRAGLSSIKLDKDTLTALLGKFVLSPAVTTGVIMAAAAVGISLPLLQQQTMIVQSSVAALAVLPILAASGHGDVTYATNLVTTSTLLFVVVIPVIMTLIS